MARLFTFIVVFLLIAAIATDANRARRLRRHQAGSSSNLQSNLVGSQTEARQQPLPNPQILNAQGQLGQQQAGLGSNQAGRQYYQYQGQYPQGMAPGGNMPYGTGYQQGFQSGYNQYPQYGQSGQYGQYGQYGSNSQYGQGMGSSGAYYNQNPGYNSFYGSNSGSYYNNRPGYSQYGSSGYGFWNAAPKQNVNVFTILFSSFVALFLCLLTM